MASYEICYWLAYIKDQDKAGNKSVRIQSALCEVACEQNSCGLKIAVVKIYLTVVSA